MSSLRSLLPYMARYRWTLLVGLICAAFGAGTAALAPLVLRIAVDEIQAGGIVINSLLLYGGLLILIAIVDGIFKFGQRMLIAGASFRIEYDMRRQLFDHYLALDQRFFGNSHTGDLMARATNDLSKVRMFLGPGINGAATALLTFLAATILMALVNIPLTLIMLTILPIGTIVFVLIGRRMRLVFTSVQDQFGHISTRAQENFSGIRTIKAYAQEEAEARVFAVDNERYRELNLRYVLLSGALWPSMTLILGLAAAFILFVGGRMVTNGTLTIGELVQFNAYLGLLSFPMIMLGWMVDLFQQAAASMDRLNATMRERPAIQSPPVPRPLEIQGAIEFRNVGIRYDYDMDNVERQALQVRPADEWMLRDISFSVPRGGSLAIVGATGAGKSTLVNLLGRVRDPDEGQVLIDEIDVRELALEQLRSAIGYVPQETFLFSVPLRENVTFGLPMNSDLDDPLVRARIDRAVQASRLSNDLTQFPEGIDTLIGERGVTLSGGQKQRTAIARAILRDPTILVLDDALSSVDTHTAAEILSALREVMRDRTSIIIAQRVATVKDADQIVVLHNGRITEQGRHHELIKLGGHYAAMYRRELLEAEMEG